MTRQPLSSTVHALGHLESLPAELLQRVCKYLDRALPFALVNRTCLFAARPRLFARLKFDAYTPGELSRNVERLVATLSKIHGFHHVQSLRFVAAPGEAYYPTFGDPDDEGLSQRWQLFRRGYRRSMAELNRNWQPVADLICMLPALVEFHHKASFDFPPCILEALKGRKCRLYLENFVIDSLFRHTKRGLTPEEQQLATWPIHSITTIAFDRFDSEGNVCYLEEAVKDMVSIGHLKEVSICYRPDRGSPSRMRAMGFPHESWDGTEIDGVRSHGSLRWLEIMGSPICNFTKLQQWTEVTDFTKLRTLRLWNNVGPKILDLLISFELNIRSLLLHLKAGGVDAAQRYAHIQRSLLTLSRRLSLSSLQLSGDCEDETLTEMLKHHPLEKLVVLLGWIPESRHDFELHPIRETWTSATVKELTITVKRLDGSKQEVAQYKLFRNFPNLRRLRLLLDCRGRGLENELDFRYVMRNHAIDRTLAAAIFRIIQTPLLENVKIIVERDGGVDTRYSPQFHALCKALLANDWTCEPGRIQEDWGSHRLRGKYIQDYDEDIIKIFHTEWPEQPGKDWRETWHNSPLHD